ncbi:hypothetical protein E2C01_024792 [Portunus trituberculatus]|uniref:Uncharacterized protein n=1 Tax=Portunus trituberculatus TaxID=210409 RepID=A0A5B7EBP3_PORTR|nr:hypothetical protein [Portunus trituberculatus]
MVASVSKPYVVVRGREGADYFQDGSKQGSLLLSPPPSLDGVVLARLDGITCRQGGVAAIHGRGARIRAATGPPLLTNGVRVPAQHRCLVRRPHAKPRQWRLKPYFIKGNRRFVPDTNLHLPRLNDTQLTKL